MRHPLAAVPASVAALLLLAGCAGPAQEAQLAEVPLERPARAIAPEELEPCDATHLADAVGKTLVRGAAAGPDEVAMAALPDQHRVVQPGMAVTMDFVPERLTVTVDRTGTITKLTCG